MTIADRGWAEKRPVLFSAVNALAGGAALVYVWWQHPAAIDSPKAVLFALMLAAPVVNTMQVVRRVRAFDGEHDACAAAVLDGALRTSALMLGSIAIFIGVWLEALRKVP